MNSAPGEIAKRFGLPEQAVLRMLNDPVGSMQMRSRYLEDCNADAPCVDYPTHERYTPRVQHWKSDPLDSYVDYIEIVDPFEVVPSEPENNIRLHPTFARYTEWFKAGMLPPYPSVFEQVKDGQRKLIGANRRRILTAREAGIRELPVWLGRWNIETGLPLKYGDILKAAQSKEK